jgi:hypothetical protein
MRKDSKVGKLSINKRFFYGYQACLEFGFSENFIANKNVKQVQWYIFTNI